MAFERRPLVIPGSPEDRERAQEFKERIEAIKLDPKAVAREEKRLQKSTPPEEPPITPNREEFEAVMEQVIASEHARRLEWEEYLRRKQSNEDEYPFDIHD